MMALERYSGPGRHQSQGPAARCLSCGAGLSRPRLRYCSDACRRQLHYRLNLHTGLMRALNIRHATFYFTETAVVMDMLPYDRNLVYRFIHPRTNGGKPSDAYMAMADLLGAAWWTEMRRTRKRYLASRRVLEHEAAGAVGARGNLQPPERRVPALGRDVLAPLRLTHRDISRPGAQGVIKRAYRQAAMHHHPDRGGSPRDFRRVHAAYEKLITWARNPTFIHYRGFPDRWFYDGGRNHWTHPVAVRRTVRPSFGR